MNTRKNISPLRGLELKARKRMVIILEELNFVWDEPELKELAQIWHKGYGIGYMAEYFARDPDEVLLALVHVAREGMIKQRKGGLLSG